MNYAMNWKTGILLGAMLMVYVPLDSAACAQKPKSRPEEIEWTWEVRPAHANAALPNVLLVGDSITRNYYPEVKQELAGVANVYLFASSTSVGDPRLPHELAEFAAMEAVPFQVVHFNNGMHGWMYSEEEYRAAFPEYLRALHKIAPHAAMIWASITPVKAGDTPGPTNVRIQERNRIAQAFVSRGAIPIDDQYELMTHHAEDYEDHVHFNPTGAAIQGKQVVMFLRAALAERSSSSPRQ